MIGSPKFSFTDSPLLSEQILILVFSWRICCGFDAVSEGGIFHAPYSSLICEENVILMHLCFFPLNMADVLAAFRHDKAGQASPVSAAPPLILPLFPSLRWPLPPSGALFA